MARSLPPDPDLARALRRLRDDREMTQESVSHAADITLGAYGRIERSEVAPSWPTVRAIARGLGISMKDLGTAVDREGRG
jgi:DNA-binding XRE family transcriptional regulator